MSLLAVVDLLAVLSAYALSAALVDGSAPVESLRPVLETSIALRSVLWVGIYALIWHLVLAATGLYGSYRLSTATREVRDLAFAAACAVAPFAALAALAGDPDMDARFAALLWASSAGMLMVSRRCLRMIGGLARRAGRNLRDVVVVGEGGAAVETAGDLARRAGLGYRVVEVIDVSGQGLSPAERAAVALRRLESVLDRHPVDEVFLAFPLDRAQPIMAEIVSTCEEQGIVVRLIAGVAPSAWAAVDTLLDHAVVTIASGPADALRLAAKRVIDVLVSAIGLLILAPALAAIAIAIKLDSTGPVIFAQERAGLNRRRFRLYKFRTMVSGADRLQAALEERNEADGPVFKIQNDPRITRLGRWLRATSLDELPQLANVVTGDMSLVGPRPLPTRDVERIDVRWHKRRFSVKPGITCLWQVRSRAPVFDEWVRSDMEYIDNWSLSLDLKILFMTLPAVLSRQNAV
jgi:exopolysaccharide biosynthesis polyprenyl glycosylphosphotransferase